MDWKIKLGITAAFLGVGAILLSVYQKQIRNVAYTAGQTVGQAIESPIEGFLEPFQALFAKFQGVANQIPTIPQPTTTQPIYVPPPIVDPAYVPGSSIPGSNPYGTTTPPPKNNNSPTQPPPQKPTTTPPTSQNPTYTPTATPPQTKNYPSSITVNSQTTTSYTTFFNAIAQQIGSFGQDVANFAYAAWQKLNQNPLAGVIVIPGFPVINVPFVPAFAQTPPANNKGTTVTDNTKTSYKMGATSYNPPVTTVNYANLANFYDVTKIAVPKSTTPTLPAGFSQPAPYTPTPLPSGSLYAYLQNQSA